MSTDLQNSLLRSENARLRRRIIALTLDPNDIYPADAEADRLQREHLDDPEDEDKRAAASAAADRAANIGGTHETRTLANCRGDIQAFTAAQGERGFINPHARPSNALTTPALFPVMDQVALGLAGAQRHEWEVLYPATSYLYDILCVMLANIHDANTLQAATWVHDIYNLFTLRVDGLTLVVQKGAEIGNATMSAAIDPFADQLGNVQIKKAYLVVKDAAAKATLRAAAARAASSNSSAYTKNVEAYKGGGDSFKGKPYSPPGMYNAAGRGAGAPSGHPRGGGGGASGAAAKST
jgi:hypothetical protein